MDVFNYLIFREFDSRRAEEFRVQMLPVAFSFCRMERLVARLEALTLLATLLLYVLYFLNLSFSSSFGSSV